MGLKCSLLGHAYGSPETERERDERGTEVVVTVRTVESCARCGERRVVNENTEVRSVAPDDDGDGDDASSSSGGFASDQPAGVQDLADAADDVLGGDTADGPAGDADEPSDAVQEPPADDGQEPPVGADASGDDGVDLGDAPSADEDDGVILTDDGEETAPDRRPGEWPDSDDTRTGERADDGAEPLDDAGASDADRTGADPTDDDAELLDGADGAVPDDSETDEADATPWPDRDGEDEGFAAEPASGGDAEVSFTGLSPETESVESDDGVTVDSGFASAGALDVAERADDAGGALVCPECGERTDAVGSSLRAGDICPECHRGYLSEEDA